MLPLHRQHGTTALAVVGALWAMLTLTACDSVNLEGKLFDWMGISGSALDAKTADPKMEDRAPLVVPPKLTRLPQPGSGKSVDGDLAALNDPEEKKKLSAKERERLHQAYCRGEIQWKEKALDPDYAGARSPYGPCGLFSVPKLN
jgi:hypothetical protein